MVPDLPGVFRRPERPGLYLVGELMNGGSEIVRGGGGLSGCLGVGGQLRPEAARLEGESYNTAGQSRREAGVHQCENLRTHSVTSGYSTAGTTSGIENVWSTPSALVWDVSSVGAQ